MTHIYRIALVGVERMITRKDWMFRYKESFVAVGLSQKEALDCANAADYEEARAGFEDDPEGAAQMEMSYWEE